MAAGLLNAKGEVVVSGTFSINRKQDLQPEDLVVNEDVQEVMHARTALQVGTTGVLSTCSCTVIDMAVSLQAKERKGACACELPRLVH